MLLTSPAGQGTSPGSRALEAETGTGGGPHAAGTAVAVRSLAQEARPLTRGEPSAFMVVPVLAGLAVLVLLGVHPPGELTDLITRGAAQLGTP